MKKDYNKRLEDLNKRRYDDSLRKAILSESYFSEKFGRTTKYVLESMKEIDPEYTKNTYIASERIQNHLTSNLNDQGIEVEFEHQGSVPTNTHIRLHSDIDLVVIHKGFYSLEPPQEPTFPYQGDPVEDLKELRESCYSILNGIYDQVDNSNSKSVTVYPTNPKRKVDVVQANWYDSNEYVENNRIKKYRGFNIYDYHKHVRKTDYPLLNISNVNDKNSNVNGGLRKAIRFLKTLKADAEYEIKLSSFEITSIAYGINNNELFTFGHQDLKLLPVLSNQLNKLIIDEVFLQNLLSPNNKEFVFRHNPSCLVEIKKLKREVDEVIEDLKEELTPLYKSIEHEFVY